MEKTVGHATDITVRPMEEDDISGVLEIDRKTTGGSRALTYQDQVNIYLGGELSLSYVAERDGRIVGFVLGRIRNLRYGIYEGAWFEMIGVDPEYKRQGIGRQLLTAFLAGCRERKVKQVHLVVSSQDREIKPFIEAIGFTPGEQIHYVKRLT
ncbi:MAG: GNAT family N-acetyltransferase [Chloroflexi bacterium]|nr:GNAT family N-acetyltransferase [Chloroflexota bacterium]